MRQKRALPRKGMREDMILFTVGGFRFAIAAAAVSEIRNMEGLERFYGGTGHKVMAKVVYTLKRAGATHFVVSGAQHFRLPPSKPTRLLVLRHTAVAVMVDSTDRMIEVALLHALPLAFSGDERCWYRGLAIVTGDVVPVVNPSAFLTRGEAAVLKAMTQPVEGVAV